MRRFLLFLFSLLTPVFSAGAHATTIPAGIYALANAYVDGYAVKGTVTFDSAGSATGANLLLDDPAFNRPGLYTLSGDSVTAVVNTVVEDYVNLFRNAGQITLYFTSTADANGFFGLCLTYAACASTAGSADPFTLQIYSAPQTGSDVRAGSGNLPAAVTPEPSTLVLLGTGVLGLAGVAVRSRRREGQGVLRVRCA